MTFDPNEYLIPVSVATGAPTIGEAILLLAYRGVGVITDAKAEQQFLTLTTAIHWNEVEAKDADGFEKQFRESLASALKEIQNNDQEFIYSDDLMFLWAKVFPEGARNLLKSQSRNVTPHIKEIMRRALKQ